MKLMVLMALLASGENPSGLPDGAGKQDVELHCTRCHSAMIIRQQKGDERFWLATLRLMQKKYGLWELPPETEKAILDYLISRYGPPAGFIGRRTPLPPELMPPPRK